MVLGFHLLSCGLQLHAHRSVEVLALCHSRFEFLDLAGQRKLVGREVACCLVFVGKFFLRLLALINGIFSRISTSVVQSIAFPCNSMSSSRTSAVVFSLGH